MALTAKGVAGVAGMVVAVAAAQGQPAATDLGALPAAGTVAQNNIVVSPGSVQWFRFSIGDVNPANDQYLDIQFRTSGVDFAADNLVGVYDSAGTLVASDDDDGALRWASLTFGARVPSRRPLLSSFDPWLDGRDGSLASGTYYIAVAEQPATLGQTVWSVTSGSSTSRSYDMSLMTGAVTPPTDLGALPMGTTQLPLIPGGTRQARWYTFTLPETSWLTGEYLDIHVDRLTANGSLPETSVTLWDSDGNVLAYDSRDVFDGAGWAGAVSFGGVAPARPLSNAVVPFDGRNGNLPAGRYYMTVANVAASGGDNFRSFAPSGGAGGNDALPILTRGQANPFPTDRWTEETDVGELPAAAGVPLGSGSLSSIGGRINMRDGTTRDTDIYEIEICDLAAFSATTEGETAADTMLFLLDPAGAGVAYNDNTPGGTTLQSTLTNALLPRAGFYYLAVSIKGRRPFAGTPTAQTMFDMTVTDQEIGPSPSTAGAPLVGWVSDPVSDGTYVIQLTGVCYPCNAPPPCIGDYDQSGGVDGDDIAAFFYRWEIGSRCADVDGSGGIDGDDIATFISAWQSGGC